MCFEERRTLCAGSRNGSGPGFAAAAVAPAAVRDARCAGEHAVPAIPTAAIAATATGNGDLNRMVVGRSARFMIIGA
ncbi:hypothetical protein GCM10029978_085920 [Actinoallomurus acanthiterrae]